LERGLYLPLRGLYMRGNIPLAPFWSPFEGGFRGMFLRLVLILKTGNKQLETEIDLSVTVQAARIGAIHFDAIALPILYI